MLSFTNINLPASDLAGARERLRQDELPVPIPMAITPYYLSLANPDDANDPLACQVIPTASELLAREYELTDPLVENKYSPVKGLIHRYPDRVLVLVTNTCASYCRFCFRRYYTGRQISGCTPSGIQPAVISAEQLAAMVTYIKAHPEVKEIILSGGDPLTQEDESLSTILKALKESRAGLHLRIGTRAPVVMPQRLDNNLVQLLAQFKPLRIVTQFNHPREIQPESMYACSRLIEAGIPVLNQSVLLRGINNQPDILKTLFYKLVQHSIKPYYLFQGDLAQGTAHFRTPLRAGLELMEQIKYEIPGLARPTYAVDLPGGGGKISLSYPLTQKNDWYEFKNREGELFYYPVES
jgi:lysine 2,3-aminomutase